MTSYFTAAEAAEHARAKRSEIDVACETGALFAVNKHPESSRKSWVISSTDLDDWHRRGRPAVPQPDAA